MTIEELELSLTKMSYFDLYHKKCYLENKRGIIVAGQEPSLELVQSRSAFLKQMIETYGPEDQHFLGTGNFNNHHFNITEISQDKRTFDSTNFISEDLDASVARAPRYLDITEMFVFINIYYVLCGKTTISINNTDYCLESGNIMILSPYVLHHMLIDDDDTCLLHLMIKESSFPKSFSNLLLTRDSVSEFFTTMLHNKNDSPFAVFKSAQDESIRKVILNIMILQYENKKLQKSIINSLAEFLILHIFCNYSDTMTIYHYKTKVIQLASDVYTFIYENFRDITLSSIAEKFSYSSKHISRVLAQVFGKNYQELVTEIRLDKARELLVNTDMGIEEICYQVGYSNSRHLRYLFKAKFGVSPRDVRQGE